jgi:hypothetical protein
MQLGRLERVDARTIWANEATHFTPWLARAENLALLGEAIGIELEHEATEKSVGPFSADILCKDTASGNWVLIENQLERTDHRHLGQLLTYASGLKAVTIVWIANPFCAEHRSALDWLNEITDSKFNFFGLEVELWKIGDSHVAPKFNVVAKPNDWSKTVSEGVSRVENEALTDTKQLQLKFWTGFKEYADTHSQNVKATKPRPQHWMNMSLGRSGFNITAIASLWKAETKSYSSGEIRAQVEIHNEDAKTYFQRLQAERTQIDSELSFPVRWVNDPTRVSCKIVTSQSVDLYNEADWPNQYQWLLEKLEELHRVFGPRVKRL